MRPLLPLLAAAALSCAAAGCQLGATVTRVQDGRPVEGRWISPEAYATFLEGGLADASGNRVAAAKLYRKTLSEDPAASEAWARLGAVLCSSDPNEADHAFSRATVARTESGERLARERRVRPRAERRRPRPRPRGARASRHSTGSGDEPRAGGRHGARG